MISLVPSGIPTSSSKVVSKNNSVFNLGAPFQKVTISSKEIFDYPATQRILENLKKYSMVPADFKAPEVVSTMDSVHAIAFDSATAVAPNNHPVGFGKNILHLTTQPGTSVKQCPGSDNMLCCHYHIINLVSNCPYDCSYCYLQTYLTQPMMTFYVNEEDIFDQVRKICERPPVSLLRIGTGEISDSLALDPLTGFSEKLAEVMTNYENVRLELKTKSKNVDHLLNLKRKDHVIFSWSINPPEIVNKEEHGTSRFEERIAAAAKVAAAGFVVGFHLDPVIYFENWKDCYERAIDYVLKNVPNEKIQWISIGGLRYLPQLKPITVRRHPDTSIYFEESVPGSDGKMRYPRFLRTEMFQFINDQIKSKAPQIYTYLCMETKPVWEKALARLPDRTF